MDYISSRPDRVTQRTSQLEELRLHWDEAYRIFFEHGRFWGQRLDNGALLNAETAAELKNKLREDYAASPVPRHGGILP